MSVGTFANRTPGVADAPRWRAWAWLAEPTVLGLAALTLLAAALRFWAIGRQGFWFDEANTVQLVRLSPGGMLGLLRHSESTPPLYYCVAWAWARVFGYGEAPLRALSAVCGVATIPVAYAAARKLVSARAGLVVSALAACSPLLIWYSQEARSYALLVLLSSLALVACAYARETPEPRVLGAWTVASALALATHYYAVVAVVPQAVWLLGRHRRRRGAVIAVGVVLACGLALLPLALAQHATGNDKWIALEPLGRRVGQVVPQFAAGFALPGQAVLKPLGVALAALGVALVVWRGDRRGRRGALWAGALALGGLALALVLVAGGFDDLLTRNLLALWLPSALVVAAGLGARRAGLAGLLATVALCAVGVTGAIGVATEQNLQRPDWRGVARLLGTRPAAGTRAILVQHDLVQLPLKLYLPGLQRMPAHGARVRELDIISFTAPPGHLNCWWGAACNLWGSQMQPTYAVSGFRSLLRAHFHQFTVLRMGATGRSLVTPHEVARALQTTRYRDDELLVQR